MDHLDRPVGRRLGEPPEPRRELMSPGRQLATDSGPGQFVVQQGPHSGQQRRGFQAVHLEKRCEQRVGRHRVLVGVAGPLERVATARIDDSQERTGQRE